MTAEAELQVTVRRDNDLVTVGLVGEVDLLTVQELRRGLNEALESGAHHVDVDFAGVTFCDAQGLAALVTAGQTLASLGRRLSVRASRGGPHRAFLLTGLAPSLHVERPRSDSALVAALGVGAASWDGRVVLDAALALVVTMAQSVVGSADGASITLPRDGRLGTVAASNDVVLQMDHDQYETGQGPCLDAAEQGERFEIRSLAAESRWPEFVPRAQARGIHSILSTPLTSSGQTVGALNVYSRHEAAFAEHEIRWADQFAAEAAKVVQSASGDESSLLLQEQIRDALRSREVIARAEGAVMARDGVTQDVAQSMLRIASRSGKTPMRTVCEDLLARLGQPLPPTNAGGSAHEGPSRR